VRLIKLTPCLAPVLEVIFYLDIVDANNDVLVGKASVKITNIVQIVYPQPSTYDVQISIVQRVNMFE
jgi:hypothetical protein